MVIPGGHSVSFVETKKSLKCKWKEIAQMTSSASKTPTSSKKPLFFPDEDFLIGEPNEFMPLFISATILVVDVKRILVDLGSSADIMFQDLLPKLGLSLSDVSPYLGVDISSLGPERTRPLGYLEVIVTYGRKKLARTVNTTFLVLPLITLYHCVVGQPTLAKLGAVGSMIQLKMKFHSLARKIVIIPANINSAKPFLYLTLKCTQHRLQRRYFSLRSTPNNELARELKIKNKRPEPQGESLKSRLERIHPEQEARGSCPRQ